MVDLADQRKRNSRFTGLQFQTHALLSWVLIIQYPMKGVSRVCACGVANTSDAPEGL
jgi:hypothetical protein